MTKSTFSCDMAARRGGSVLLERGHGETRRLQLLPVELGGLPRTGPDRRLAAVVDRVREPIATVEAHPWDHPGERLGDVIEGVVVVVEDDHEPISAQGLVRTR